jgi:formate dehydrogenase accessory protein FdhE
VIGLAPDALDPAEGLRAVLARRPEVVPGGDLAATALRLHWFPLLSALPRPAAEWRQGVCPGCGQGPALAELRGLEQGRFLRCGWCAAGWEVPRQFCPRCGTTDYRHLAYLQIEGEESRRRVAVCHACHGYVKTVNVLTGPPPVGVLVNDVATLDLDLAAAERGFGAPT